MALATHAEIHVDIAPASMMIEGCAPLAGLLGRGTWVGPGRCVRGETFAGFPLVWCPKCGYWMSKEAYLLYHKC